MRIALNNLGKRFNRHWVFRNLDYVFFSKNAYAITGANGSGKSTLLQVLAGATQHSEGSVEMTTDNGQQTTYRQNHSLTNTTVVNRPSSVLSAENHFRQLSVAAPYLELIEEFTLNEFLAFHFHFKQIFAGQTIASIIDIIGLKDATNKQIRYYSSGMKQRVKLAQAIFSDVPIVLLDEPTSNLDKLGVELYKKLINDFCLERLVVICSNEENEIDFCKERIDISKYK